MNLTDILGGIGKLTRSFHILEERVNRLEKDVPALEEEIITLRRENADLTTRVAVLEENRKTVAAEVKLALTEAITAWEMQKLREQLQTYQAQEKPPILPG